MNRSYGFAREVEAVAWKPFRPSKTALAFQGTEWYNDLIHLSMGYMIGQTQPKSSA
jgi:hypothetical protein